MTKHPPVEWTPPYHGVQHIKTPRGAPLLPQFTLSDRGTFAEAHVYGHGSRAQYERLFRGPDRVAKAQQYLARMYRLVSASRLPPPSSGVCPTCGKPR